MSWKWECSDSVGRSSRNFILRYYLELYPYKFQRHQWQELGILGITIARRGASDHYTVKCTAWVAISKHGIIRPFWFENEAGETVTGTKEHNILVLNKFLTPWTIISGGSWRKTCMRTILNLLLNWKWP